MVKGCKQVTYGRKTQRPTRVHRCSNSLVIIERQLPSLSWPLSNTGLNCMGSLICGLFLINTSIAFDPPLRVWGYGEPTMHWAKSFYIGNLSICGFWYFLGVLELIPYIYQRDKLSFGEIRSYTWILNCRNKGVDTPKPHIVQGLTVLHISISQ